MLLWLIAPIASAATLTVCDTGCDFVGIQAAVDAADDGDVVYVSEPNFELSRAESVRVGKSIAIIGRNGVGKPWRGVGATSPPLTVEGGATVRVRGFRLIPAAAAPAAYVGSGSRLELEEAEIRLDPSAARAWIDVDAGASARLERVLLDGTGASDSNRARGVHVGAGASLEIEGSVLRGFWHCRGGAVLALDAASVSVRDSRIVGNRASYCVSAEGEQYGGGLRLLGVPQVEIVDTLFEGNIAVVGAGAAIDEGEATVVGAVFRNNNPSSYSSRIFADGSGLYQREGVLRVQASAFTDNYAGQGGAIEIRQGEAEVVRSFFANNTAQREGGAIFIHGNDEIPSGLRLEASTLRGNRGPYGAGIRAGYQAGLDLFGNAFIANEITTTADNPRGGAILMENGQISKIEANLLCENRAQSPGSVGVPQGTAIYGHYAHDLSLQHNLFVRNQEPPNTAPVVLAAARLDLVQNTFAGNGGKYDILAIEDQGTRSNVLKFTNNAFLRNTGDAHLGILGDEDPSARFLGNTAWVNGTGRWLALGSYGASVPLQVEQSPVDPGWTLSGVCEDLDMKGTNTSLLTGGVDLGGPFGRHQGAPTLIAASVAPGLPILDHDSDGAIGVVDCDDADKDAFPGGPEACDGRDTDCGGLPDWDDPRLNNAGPTVYPDADRDGYGNGAGQPSRCGIVPHGFAAEAGDCAPNDASRSPGVEEVPYNGIDDDCDLSTRDDDVDGDGFPVEIDCDDGDAAVHPGAAEVCDGVDQDCDELVDEQPPEGPVWYEDADRDGFGAGPELVACEAPRNFVDTPGDCDDNRAAVHPEAIEVCNGLDDDCDRETDVDAADAQLFYRDSDGDGWGGPATALACAQPPSFVTNNQDCDDSRQAAFPAAQETCNELDDDCDEQIDEEAIDAQPWYADGDGDGWGAGGATYACDPLPEHADRLGDCDDTDSDRNPEAIEVACNGVDEDCEPSTGETGCGDTGDSDSGDSDTGDSDTGDSDTGDSDTGDSSDTADSSDSEDTGDTDDSEPIPTFVAQLTGGAGCASAPSPGAWGLFGLLALGMPRRRA